MRARLLALDSNENGDSKDDFEEYRPTTPEPGQNGTLYTTQKKKLILVHFVLEYFWFSRFFTHFCLVLLQVLTLLRNLDGQLFRERTLEVKRDFCPLMVHQTWTVAPVFPLILKTLTGHCLAAPLCSPPWHWDAIWNPSTHRHRLHGLPTEPTFLLWS